MGERLALRAVRSPVERRYCLSQWLPAAENVAGQSVYVEVVRVTIDPSHRERADMLRWAGLAFDPARFDLNAMSAAYTDSRCRRDGSSTGLAFGERDGAFAKHAAVATTHQKTEKFASPRRSGIADDVRAAVKNE